MLIVIVVSRHSPVHIVSEAFCIDQETKKFRDRCACYGRDCMLSTALIAARAESNVFILKHMDSKSVLHCISSCEVDS